MVTSRHRFGLVSCASYSTSNHGHHVHGHEQRNSQGDGRDKEDA